MYFSFVKDVFAITSVSPLIKVNWIENLQI